MTQSGRLEIEVEERGRSLTSQVVINVQTAAWVALTDRLRGHWSSCESSEGIVSRYEVERRILRFLGETRQCRLVDSR
ncbi:hypothetical protein NEUTE1DRAFT_47735 [Neurospora tetrasperma FGSC 2508]|uniref:Uncharacterized protein n=1 Tax=Neurospora tetrasperma (strain FGSC 2508 / ATCC MYA-4615 / P0657) TaxID=510951 RepID=F8MU14_NEUT8|nr:uncharacterized protein NEUTE1DRAFT_47735 [Neurospora tetrasperma FGSC 2508]EGO55496.1 hypothetical protein NEUTE1DRAFT_47735 [Neurospora tetrasperma FGSC 2508]EGZ69273.1 hypothetical protein NEUTE2DRAFT_71026 [Neurospora tetrasperma FGSC 2509]